MLQTRANIPGHRYSSVPCMLFARPAHKTRCKNGCPASAVASQGVQVQTQSKHGRRRCISKHEVTQSPYTCRLLTLQVPSDALLNDIRVVLVSPKHEANIGAVARCCANFEALHLCIVNPRCDPKGGEVYKVACGMQVIDRMMVVDTLEQALADTIGSIGFTRRAGATRLTHASLSHMLHSFPNAIPAVLLHNSIPARSQANAGSASAFLEAARAAGTTALVFGREEDGLSEMELRLCSHACAIPTGQIQPSMNLSHAVAVVLAELFNRRSLLLEEAEVAEGQGSLSIDSSLLPAKAQEVEALIVKVAAIAEAAGLSGMESSGGGNAGNHGRKRLPVGHARAVLGRAQVNMAEVRSLHGLASAVMKKLPQAEQSVAGEQQ